jgi:acetyltransferase-like isoleucine patch superfamily enzyme
MQQTQREEFKVTSAYEIILSEIQDIVSKGTDTAGTRRILHLIGGPDYPAEMLEGIRLWNEFLPKAEEMPYTQGQRYLHFLWEAFDRLPLCVSIPFAIPYRRILASKLFAKCGKNFICEENCRFNFGQNLEVGDNVMFNRGCYFDTKGGITFGNFTAAAEYVKIFTHSHGEADHMARTYAKVVIEDFAKIFAGVTILPGVTVGAQAIVAADSMVAKDVPKNMVAAGTPAKTIRVRRNEDRTDLQLNHYWLAGKAFQTES